MKTCSLKDADLKIDGKSTRDRLKSLEISVILLSVALILTQIALFIVISGK